MPRLAADFSHVRRLRLTSLQLAGSDCERMFPALKNLELSVIPLHTDVGRSTFISLQTLTELELTFLPRAWAIRSRCRKPCGDDATGAVASGWQYS